MLFTYYFFRYCVCTWSHYLLYITGIILPYTVLYYWIVFSGRVFKIELWNKLEKPFVWRWSTSRCLLCDVRCMVLHILDSLLFWCIPSPFRDIRLLRSWAEGRLWPQFLVACDRNFWSLVTAGTVAVSLFVAGAIFGHVGVSLFVASALFGDVGVTISVAGAAFGWVVLE